MFLGDGIKWIPGVSLFSTLQAQWKRCCLKIFLKNGKEDAGEHCHLKMTSDPYL